MRTEPSPASLACTPTERRLIARLRTPAAVQRFLNALPYNTEPPPGRATLRSFRGVVRHQTAHCLEAVLTAAVILEQHGYPPLALSFESVDELDHVLFVYRHRGRWGSVARSRDPGLHGRKPVFRTARALALSYVEPYVDFTARITGYAVVDLRVLDRYDWRLSERNVWKVEQILLDYPHRRIRTPDHRIDRWRTRYRDFMSRFPNRKPMFFGGGSDGANCPRNSDMRSGVAIPGAPDTDASVEIEIAVGAGDRFPLGLLEGLLEPLREGVATVLLVADGLLKQRFPALGFLGQNSMRLVDFRRILTHRRTMPDDSLQMRIDRLGSSAARAHDLEFRRQLDHSAISH